MDHMQEERRTVLTDRERERYARQLLLIGDEGQEQLKKATIFIAGAGGLGSPVSMYLAALGVGTIVLADQDVVERTNLNRQVLHHDCDIGKGKTESAREKLEAINPDITIRVFYKTIDGSSVRLLVGGADGIVDAVDNYATRYLLNEVSLENRIPLFHGAVRGMFGQATTILPGKTACLRCLFPSPPPMEVCPVVGMTAGIIGTVQATEVFKYLVQDGELLTNRLLLWDGMQSRAEELVVEKNPRCPACGTLTRVSPGY